MPTVMSSQVAIKLTGPMDHLRLVWQTGEALLESIVFDEDPEGTRYNLLVALQEMVTNVLRHGYRLDESKPVEVVFDLSEESMRITLRDQGPAFDPLTHEAVEVVDEAMPTEAGGHGIRIAKLVMDRVDYERQGTWNVLTMTKFVRAIATT